MICRKVLFLAGLTLCLTVHVSGQIVTSAQNGFWNDPSTWEGGTVPAMGNSSVVHVNHAVALSTVTEVGVLEISGSLTITQTGSLEMLPPQGGGILRVLNGGILHVSGALTGNDSVQFETNASNTFFDAGGVFVFRGSSRSYIPIASWDGESVLHITGFSSSGYVALAYSDGWKQSFGHVIYDCAQQTSFVDFNGHLSDIRGDLIIRNTNNQSLRLSTTQRPVIRIGRDFRIEGPSEIWVTTTSDSAQLIIGRDFHHESTSSGPTYLATRGRCHVQVGRTFRIDSSGPLRFCSGSADSTGVRRSTIAVSGDFQLLDGDLIAPSPGKGTFLFTGTAPQNITIENSTLTGSFDLHVEAAATVDFGTNVVRTQNGNAFVKGRIRLGSTDEGGALQNGDGGNLRVNGLKQFYSGAVLEYNGLAGQFVGDGHPTNDDVDVIFNNNNGVQLLEDITAGNIDVLSGELDANNHSLTAYGDVLLHEGAQLVNAETITLTGTRDVFLSLRGARIRELYIAKSQPAEVVVTSPLELMESLAIVSENTILNSNGNITLLSYADTPGATARVTPVPDGSRINGDITVQRYMSGEGRLYRYLASPVANASVASMMDDFPVTGTFADPSTGRGIASTSPSLFFYDSGWKPFPVSGAASDNYLEPGRGYAAFVRGDSNPIVWDVTGELNQGPHVLNVKRTVQDGDPFTGWNLVGNPYASPVKWGGAGWTLQNIGMSIAIRDNGENRFRYTDGEVGDVANGTIASGQAFWVYATDDNPTLSINESAKSSGDASFYRFGETDHVQLSITGPEGEDMVWLRLRPAAAKTLDRFDAVKLPNDELSLAILTTDSVAVAIAASDEFDCNTVIPVSITGPSGGMIRPGNYTMSIETSGMFSGSTVRLIDYFNADTTALGIFHFVVNEDPGSAQPNRFGLLVSKSVSAVLPELDVPVHCHDTLVQINVRNGSEDARVVASLNGRFFYPDAAGVINMPYPFGAEDETLNVIMTSEAVCQRTVFDTLRISRHQSPTAPTVSNVTRCGPGSVILRASAKDNYQLLWFDDEFKDNPVFIGNNFNTPPMSKSKTFYVLAEDSFGCRSELTPVNCEVILPDSLKILRKGRALASNYSDTKWFVDRQLLHVGQTFEPAEPGYVTGSAEVEGCVVTTTYGYYDYGPIITPRLFDSQLSIAYFEGDTGIVIQEVLVYDKVGRQILRRLPESDQLIIDTTGWPDGVFIILIRANRTTYRVRVVKKR